MTSRTDNPLISNYENAINNLADYSIGENGMVQYNSDGLTSSNDKVKRAEAALSALSVQLVRGDKTGNPKMGKRGNDAVLNGFEAVYPPNFEGKILMDGGKNYYSGRIGGKMAFGFK